MEIKKENWEKKFFTNSSTISIFTKQKFYSYSHSPVAFIGTDLLCVVIKSVKAELGHIQTKNKELLWTHKQIQKANILNIVSH